LLRQDLAAALSDGGPAGVALAADGFGEALPIACDETPIGRELNRRVELWVRPVTGSQASEN
jgi:phosphate transport system substrate-binding protein